MTSNKPNSIIQVATEALTKIQRLAQIDIDQGYKSDPRLFNLLANDALATLSRHTDQGEGL
jgi:hypothetical protein